MASSSLSSSPASTTSTMMRQSSPMSSKVDRYRRMRKQRTSTTPKASSSTPKIPDENRQPLGAHQATPMRAERTATPGTSPLSPRNGSFFKQTEIKPTPPSRIRTGNILTTTTTPSPLANAPSPTSSVASSARRERRQRHAKLLGSRGGRTIMMTPRASLSTTASLAGETPSTIATPTAGSSTSISKRAALRRTQSSSSTTISNYYSYEAPSTTSKNKKPPKTPGTSSSNISVSSKTVQEAREVSKRVKERRARGAKKLFILATSPSMMDTSNDDNLTPLERHLTSQNESAATEKQDCPSMVSDVSTLTMSTLSSLARDKRKFSRNRRYSASKLYARATGSTGTTSIPSGGKAEVVGNTTNNKISRVQQRGRSPIRTTKPTSSRSTTPTSTVTAKDRGTSIRANSLGVRRGAVRDVASQSTTSGSGETPLSRRATSLQKAKRLARSRSADRRKSANNTTSTSSRPSTPTLYSSRSTSVERRNPSVERSKRYESPARDVSPARSVGSASSYASSRAGSRAASIQKARKTLARTKSQGKLKVETSVVRTNTPTHAKASPPAFVAREKVEARARSLSTAPQTRRNLDKRTARLKYHNEFEQEVIRYHQETGNQPPYHVGKENLIRRGENGVSIFIRKRPIFEYETQAGDFDVVFTEERQAHDAVVLYQCNMHADMQQKIVKPTVFPCSAAFDETCTNEMLYNHIGKPLVRLAVNGGLATLLTFGQTGSGKTHTITGMEEHVCQDLYRMASKFVQVQVQFVELAGKQCNDLLGGGDVKLVDQPNGSVLLLNTASEKARSCEELHNAILRGKQKRATASTDKNDVSSRSHSVLQITITSTKNEKQRGVLTLIDCAGSERRNDSMYHSRERQKESTEINSSLWALKECIRARASSGGGSNNTATIPYRSSNLTRILRESLEKNDAQLCVIATVAPNATDTEHSMETLKTVSQLTTKDNGAQEMKARIVTEDKKPALPISPKQWNHAQLVKWLNTKKFKEQEVPRHIDGKQVMRMNRIQLKNAFFGGEDGDGADRMFNALRAESDIAYRKQHESRMATSRGFSNQTYEL